MAGEKPIFPMQLEMEYFQVLEEARRPWKKAASSPDSLRFVLKKPTAKEDPRRHSRGKKRRKWWRNPLLFLKWRRADGGGKAAPPPGASRPRQSFSGPVYFAESSPPASLTPCRRKSSSGPLRLSEMGDLEMPYFCLGNPLADMASPSNSMPIYLVT